MSTQNALKQDSVTKESGHISSFQELADVLKEDERLSDYNVDFSGPDLVNMTRDGLSKVFLGPDLWTSLERRLPYLESAGEHGIAVVCVGTAEDFATYPVELRRPDIQQLGLPLSRINLVSAVASLHNFQALIEHSHAERQIVEQANENVKYVMSISRELNGERDIPKLLNLILRKAREICQADAGSIYTVECNHEDIREGTIYFRFTQNDSVPQDYSEFQMPVSDRSMVGNAIIHEVSINIPDLYQLSAQAEDNPFGAVHDRTFDKRTGYESHSMLTVPMFDISHNVIGVIQLINRKRLPEAKLLSAADFAGFVIPFDEVDQEYVDIVAQQAGIALENAKMQNDIQELFDGFVEASVTAIEQRDPTTSGHSHRVKNLCMALAEVVNRTDAGPFGGVYFNENHLKELEYASLLHDFGKLGVSENVLVKAKKLYPWQLQYVHQRFELIQVQIENEYLRRLVQYLQNPDRFPMAFDARTLAHEKDVRLKDLREYLAFIEKANEPTVLEQGGFERLKDIAGLRFKRPDGSDHPFLLSEELEALSVSRGSLTREEFAEIQSHVTHTFNFLRQIPWGRRLANVPQIAAKHHEKLDGSGYPTSAAGDEIPVQSRIMTIADIYDALTASDRPYKKAVPKTKALEILEVDVRSGRLDANLFKLFIDSKVYEVNPAED